MVAGVVGTNQQTEQRGSIDIVEAAVSPRTMSSDDGSAERMPTTAEHGRREFPAVASSTVAREPAGAVRDSIKYLSREYYLLAHPAHLEPVIASADEHGIVAQHLEARRACCPGRA